MKKIIFPVTLLLCTLLSGCLPAVFVAGATTGGTVISDKRSVSTMLQDKRITCEALLDLNRDPCLKEGAHVAVTAFNRVVLLVGEVKSPALCRRAYDIVQNIPNIRRINNQIRVAEPVDKCTFSNDIWITTKVKGAMLAEKDLHSTQIKVLTEDSVVYLMGLVSHEQADIAIAVARQVTGVRKVVTLFEYTG